jgi:hypothetical protein
VRVTNSQQQRRHTLNPLLESQVADYAPPCGADSWLNTHHYRHQPLGWQSQSSESSIIIIGTRIHSLVTNTDDKGLDCELY